mmetsp:Transcript_31442/g.58115  ORF Transcript_31442/g.58115 Transcript_31442/m.58115 type:complete len:175 (-) Transcript_31442:462-986(-)
MTIYEGESVDTRDDWEEKEQIVLSDYKTKEEMHALMVEKGFQLKSEEEIVAMKLATKLQNQKHNAEVKKLNAEKSEENRLKNESRARERRESQERIKDTVEKKEIKDTTLEERRQQREERRLASERKHNEIPEGSRYQPNAQLSPKLRKQQMKEKLKLLKDARENYMVVGAPRG